MNAATSSLLYVGPGDAPAVSPAWGAVEVHTSASLDEAVLLLQQRRFDGLLLVLPSARQAEDLAAWAALSQAVQESAVVVVASGEPDAAMAARLMPLGVADLLSSAEAADAAVLSRRLALAVQRKSLEQLAQKSQLTDLSTGLPNQTRLLDHLTHLFALREREPAPMALLALRVGGLARIESMLGLESANVLRRKAAVRLRSALRASDVVASIGRDAFGVLLAWIDSADDGQRVAAKLAQTLHRPFSVTGREVGITVSIGFSLYPEHGRDAETLLRRAVAQANLGAAEGQGGFATIGERGAAPAANDDEA
jgi:diguanylate cyclase (GGDEF)-like protein